MSSIFLLKGVANDQTDDLYIHLVCPTNSVNRTKSVKRKFGFVSHIFPLRSHNSHGLRPVLIPHSADASLLKCGKRNWITRCRHNMNKMLHARPHTYASTQRLVTQLLTGKFASSFPREKPCARKQQILTFQFVLFSVRHTLTKAADSHLIKVYVHQRSLRHILRSSVIMPMSVPVFMTPLPRTKHSQNQQSCENLSRNFPVGSNCIFAAFLHNLYRETIVVK